MKKQTKTQKILKPRNSYFENIKDSLTLEKLQIYQKGIVVFIVVWTLVFGYLHYTKIASVGMMVGFILFAGLLFWQKHYYPDSEIGLSFDSKGLFGDSSKSRSTRLLPTAEELGLPDADEYSKRLGKGLEGF